MRKAVLWPRLRRESIVLALPVTLAGSSGFPLNEIAVDGVVRARQLESTVSTAVSSPIGRIPVTGRVFAHRACDGAFAGTVTYSRWVRLVARLRGISLVTALDGRLHDADPASCTEMASTLSGRFRLADSVVIGDLATEIGAWVIVGVVRAVGDSAYYAELTMAAATNRAAVSVHLYER
ncbi:MAG: hypothetical protein ACT4PJ_14485 [Gemmatimonadaceae bacterium]